MGLEKTECTPERNNGKIWGAGKKRMRRGEMESRSGTNMTFYVRPMVDGNILGLLKRRTGGR